MDKIKSIITAEEWLKSNMTKIIWSSLIIMLIIYSINFVFRENAILTEFEKKHWELYSPKILNALSLERIISNTAISQGKKSSFPLKYVSISNEKKMVIISKYLDPIESIYSIIKLLGIISKDGIINNNITWITDYQMKRKIDGVRFQYIDKIDLPGVKTPTIYILGENNSVLLKMNVTGKENEEYNHIMKKLIALVLK